MKLDFAKETYSSVKKFITLADNKANITITIQSLLVSIGLGASLLANTIQNLKILDQMIVTVLFILIVSTFIILSFVGIGFSISVYFAKLDKSKFNDTDINGSVYFGDIAKEENSEEYYKKINNLNEDTIIKNYTEQIYILSTITSKKMKNANRSIFLTGINLILTVLLLIISGVINFIV